jgi:succinoglycan biosynthesis protein ExoA
MPVRNEERNLEDAVRHVLGQEYPGDTEVVLAVGPSRDRTAEIAAQLAASDPRVTVVPNPTGQMPNAVNLAIKASRHGIVARVDGHCELPPGYLRTAVLALQETGAANVGGIMAAAGVTPFQKAVAWAMTSPFGVGASAFHTGGQPGPADTVYLGVYRRDAIERVGGYDETFLVAEDWEMNHRIRQAGGLIWFLPEISVTYRPRATARTLALQYFRYGRWRRVVARQLAGIAGLAGLAAGAGSWATVLASAGFAVPLLYLAGITAVSALAARRLPAGVAARLPLVLATMHMSWGSGFLTSPARLVPPASAPSQQPAPAVSPHSVSPN